MNEAKRRRLEAAGWTETTADEFAGLTAEESVLLEVKLALRRAVKERREALGITQEELAERFGSSQSRVAKMEGSDASVSLDIFVRALAAMGSSRIDLARALASESAEAA